MNNRRVLFVFLRAMLSSIAVVGSLYSSATSAAPALPVVARLHWLGLNRISADTNAATVMKIWHLPETAALERQTLDKLSRWLAGGTNAASAKLRPLLDDFMTSEFYLEIHAPTNVAIQTTASHATTDGCRLLLALRLPAQHIKLWQTNLAAAVEYSVGHAVTSTEHGWRTREDDPVGNIQFYHDREWAMVSLGWPYQSAPQSILEKLVQDHSAKPTNSWFDADFNLSDLHQRFCLSTDPSKARGPRLVDQVIESLLSNVARIHLSLIGEREDVLTHATVTLSRPLFETNLPPWNIPTNFFRNSLTRFAAIRGFKLWLSTLPVWQKANLVPPDQAYFWAQSGMPFQVYLAFPQPEASNRLFHVAQRIIPDAKPWLATNGQGSLAWIPNPPKLELKDAMLMEPFLEPSVSNGRGYLLGGLFPLPPGAATPPPKVILDPVLYTPDLIYYQAEQTGPLVEDELMVNQLLRLFFQNPQLPPASASMHWLKELETVLKGCATSVTASGPTELVIKRRSTLGLNAFELHLLTDWLESPDFPKGLHTFTTALK